MVVCLTVSCTHNKTSLSIGPGVVSLSSPQDVIVEMTGETYDKLEYCNRYLTLNYRRFLC